jgi:hypothetical protein
MDRDHVSALVQLGSTQQGVAKAQTLAEAAMNASGYGYTLHNACAATLSEFMNLAGIDVPITLGVTVLASRIKNRGWGQVTVGDQQAGDVAVAKGDLHIFLVVQTIDKDVMVIADNQAPGPHRRKASGDPALNHTRVAYFLRAADAVAPVVAPPQVPVQPMVPTPDLFPQRDEDTGNLKEPFDDDGQPVK